MTNYRIPFIFTLILGTCTTKAQENKTSTPGKQITAYTANKFDFAKPLSVSFTQLTPYDYSAKTKSGDLPDGKVNNISQLKASINTHFIQQKKWQLGVGLGYEMTSIWSDLPTANHQVKQDFEDQFHYHYSSVNFTYFSKLFKKNVVYTASAIVDGSDKHFERIKGLGTATMILKADQKTKIMVGLVAVIDPSSDVPVIPTFAYERKFENGWSADIFLPQRLMIKKEVSDKGRFSLGTEFGRTAFYIYDSNDSAKKYEFRQIELNNGLTYEHLLGKYFVLSAKSGLRYTPTARIFEKDESFNDYLYEMKPKSGFYFNVGLAFNPFFKNNR